MVVDHLRRSGIQFPGLKITAVHRPECEFRHAMLPATPDKHISGVDGKM
jgi:hypothetical protein